MTATATLDALLSAILANPDEDTPRLEWADALDEAEGRATERAEFIRVQVKLHSGGPHVVLCGKPASKRHQCCGIEGCDWCELRRRERELQLAHGVEWSRVGLSAPNEIGFDRGFVGSVSLDWHDLEKYAARLFREHPITQVRLLVVSPECRGDDTGGDDVWVWHRASPDSSWVCGSEYAYIYPHYLHHELYDLLDPRQFGRISFATERQAREALSRACVVYGRLKAES